MGKKVIVAGHICLDITPVFPDKKVSGVSEMLAPGKLIEMGNADVHTGGAVANTGLALKLLGADVSLMEENPVNPGNCQHHRVGSTLPLRSDQPFRSAVSFQYLRHHIPEGVPADFSHQGHIPTQHF